MKKRIQYIIDTLLCRMDRRFSLMGRAKVRWLRYKLDGTTSVTISDSVLTRTSLQVRGQNNRIVMKNGASVRYTQISIEGDNNEVVLDGCLAMIGLLIKGNGCRCSVGRGAHLDESSNIYLMGQNNHVEIGRDCMFAEHVEIWATDTHPITDLEGRVLNPSQPVVVEDHVWLGKHVNVMKGVTIGHHAVVGLGSVVTKDIPPHSIAAGNPARVVRTGVDWQMDHICI